MSNKDFMVLIRTDAANPFLLVVSPPGGVEEEIPRATHPALTQDAIDELRKGAAKAATIDTITTEVTNWFLGDDLRGVLQGAMAQPLRLVIRTDQKSEKDFASFPFELAKWDAHDPLVLLNNITGIVYAPRTTPSLGAPATQPAFRVLLVRAEPNNHAGTVPSGIDLRDRLITVMRDSPIHTEVRLLSRENGADGPATQATIDAEINARQPSVVVYLGHGDLLDNGPSAPASPVLLVERNDGEQGELTAMTLRELFRNKPVPLVVLAGCLTGAAPVPVGGLRFGQSMAQFLVGGQGGVTVAIGMRYKLDTEDASVFLEKLFASLFAPATAGHVDLAVKKARSQLFQNNSGGLGWAAPVIYRRITSEPLFPDLLRKPFVGPPPGPATGVPPAPQVDAEEEMLRLVYTTFWETLKQMPLNSTSAEMESQLKLSHPIDEKARARFAKHNSVGVLPRLSRVVPDGSTVDASVAVGAAGTKSIVKFELTDDLEVGNLTLALVVRGGARWSNNSATLSPAAKVLGYQLEQNRDPQLISVAIKRQKPLVIPAGVLLEAELDLPTASPAVVEISVTGVSCEPPQQVAGWLAAVIVRPA